MTSRTRTPKLPSTTTTSPRAITQLLTMISTGSITERLSSTMDPVVSFNTSFNATCARPKETLTGSSTSSSKSKVFDAGGEPADATADGETRATSTLAAVAVG